MSSTDKAIKAEEIPRVWDQEILLQTIKRTTDPRFGDITVMKHSKSNEVYFAKEKMTTSKADAQNDLKELKNRQDRNGKGLQEMKGYSAVVKKELCSTNYITKGFYEFPRTDLQKESGERKRNGEDFSSSELTDFLYQGLEGLEHLHNSKLNHGDIRPQLIGFNRGAGEIKLLDRLADPSPLEKAQSSNIINKKELYMSPELYRKLTGKNKTLKYSADKNDLYSLGLSLVCLGSGESAQSAYRPNGDFDQSKIDEMLSSLDHKVGAENPFLMTVLRSMLAANEVDRPDFKQLRENMKNNNIKFQPTNVVVNKQDFENKPYATYSQAPVVRSSYSNTNYVQTPIQTQNISPSNGTTKVIKRSYIDGKLVDEKVTYEAAPSNEYRQSFKNEHINNNNNSRVYSTAPITYETVPSNEYRQSFKKEQINNRVYNATHTTYSSNTQSVNGVKVYIIDENGNKIEQDPSKYAHLINNTNTHSQVHRSSYRESQPVFASNPVSAPAPASNYFLNDEPSVGVSKNKYIIDDDCVREVPVTDYLNENFDDDTFENNIEEIDYDN